MRYGHEFKRQCAYTIGCSTTAYQWLNLAKRFFAVCKINFYDIIYFVSLFHYPLRIEGINSERINAYAKVIK